MKQKTGVLLVNLGTPDSFTPRDVYRYLIEFLTDPRVIDKPWLMRQLLVRGCIVPFRYRQSARSYKEIWTAGGSPLKMYGFLTKDALQIFLGENFLVDLAMRYREPSIAQSLQFFKQAGVQKIVVLPLFPQYASATTGSVHQKVMEIVSKYSVIPEMIFVSQYAEHPGLITAFKAAATGYHLHEYDHIIISFHGLPQSQILKADRHGHCLKTADCCSQLSACNWDCYSAQCYATARALVQALELTREKYSVVFQSRLGRDPWLQPYFSKELENLAHRGHKKILVFCPSFVCDCLETIYEIGVEYAAEFKRAGGDRLDLVPGLNDHSAWIEALASIVIEHLGGQLERPLTFGEDRKTADVSMAYRQ